MSPFRLLVAAGALLSMLGAAATTASAAPPAPAFTCTGASLQSPGVIPPGTYGSLTVNGVCLIPGRHGDTVNVQGNVNVTPGSTLLANFPALGPGMPEGDATVNVGRNVLVGTGATLILGCTPSNNCVNTTHDTVGGNLVADAPLGVLVHGDAIAGNVTHTGGGGGVSCTTSSGFFAAIGLPVFSAYEDSSVGGNVVLSGIRSCWLGLARVQVGGNAIFEDNNLADPDAIEILSNTISHNLICQGNSMVWNSFEAGEQGLFPRVPAPNTVLGQRIGQCVLASPTTPGGPLGPGPF